MGDDKKPHTVGVDLGKGRDLTVMQIDGLRWYSENDYRALQAENERLQAQVAAAGIAISQAVSAWLEEYPWHQSLADDIDDVANDDARDALEKLLHKARIEGARAMRAAAVDAVDKSPWNEEVRYIINDAIRAIDPEQVVKGDD